MKQKLIIAIMLIMQLQAFAQLTYKTTWVANTGGTWKTFTQMYMNGVGLSKAGLVAGVTTWDEGGRGLGLYNSSDGSVKNTEWNDRWAGTCVGINLNFVYTAVGDYIAKRPISNTKSIAKSIKIPNIPEYTCEPIAFSSDGFTTDFNRKKMGITGASANEAFVVVAVYVLNKVLVYNTNLTLLREINIDRPFYGTADDNGNVWVIQGADADNVCKIVEFNTSGVATGKEINGLSDPRSLQVNASGQLVVGDNGANQQVFFYDITAAPNLVKTFGQKGGITTGIPGEVKPDKFNGIVYAGTDSLNNLFVITNREGAVIRKFSPANEQLWQRYGLAFVDMADADPRNENIIYSQEEKYVMEYSKENGQEQTYTACILNADKYPEDARINQSLDGGVWIRYINGKKFMFVGNMYRDFIFIYRFNSETDGEIAIPCGAISRSLIQDITEWPAYQPKVGSFIWRDLNGNGKFDQNEYQSVPYQISMANVDDVGNIYLAEGFDYFECQGLDEIGNPVYTFENKVTNAFPAPFNNVKKVVYDNHRDVMYITGNSETLSNNYNVGPTFGAYPNWSKGNRTPAWIKNYNFDYNGFAAKNDYFFVAYSYTLNDCGIDVFKTSDGTKVGTFGTQQLDEFGWIDIPWGLMAEQRANGEYLVFREDDWVAKTVIQRWNPYSADAEKPTKPLNLQLVSKTSSSVTVSYNRATDATGLSGYFIYANDIKNNQLTVWDTVYTITGLQANTDYNITIAAADYASNETLSDIIQVKTFETDLTKPNQPSGIVASNINYTSFSLKWSKASDNIGTIGYNVFLDNQKIGYKLIEDTTFTFTKLMTSHQYQIKLVAYDYAGNVSDTSEIVNVATLTDSKAPSTPTLYASSLKSSSEIALTWASSTDNVNVEYYNLYQNGNLLKENIPAHEYMGIPISGEQFINYKITGLQSDSVYNLSVKGFDISGNGSEFSNTVTVKTDSAWGRLLEIEEADMSHMEHILAYGRYFEASGFVAGMMKQQGYVEWTVDVPTDTLYRFITHYGSMEDFPFNMQVDVNGVKQASFTLYTLPSMVSWMVFEDDPGFVIVRLKAGTNLIRLSSFSEYAPNLDFVKILIPESITSVTGIKLDTLMQKFSVPDKFELKPIFTPANASNKGIIWKTSKNSIVNVSPFGLITANRIGSAVITATTMDGGFSDSITITVSPTPWKIIDDAATGWTWYNFDDYDCGTCYDGTVHSANDKDDFAQYTFTGTDVAAFCETWDGAGDVEIFIDGVSKGTFSQSIKPYADVQKFATISNLTNTSHVIKFVAKTDNEVSIDYIYYISPASGVTVTPATVMLDTKKSISLTASILPLTATLKLVTWATSNPLIAPVSTSGYVTGVAAGDAVITVTTVDGSFTAQCMVTVKEPYTNIVSVSDSHAKVYPNPANSQLFIELPTAILNNGTEVQLFNSLSALVKTTGLLNANQNQTVIINTSDLSNGIYYLRIISKNSQISEKIVISK